MARPAQPFVYTIGPLGAASANIITTTTRATAGLFLAINGAGSDGTTANNVCLSQTPGGAGNLVLNGTLASSVPTGTAIAYLGRNERIYFTFAADESARTFTITGTFLTPTGLVSQTEVRSGNNTSIVASQLQYYTITSIAIDAASAGAITVGRSGIATLDQQRQVSITSAGNDSGINFTLVGTNANGDPVTETFAGGNATAALSSFSYKTVTSVRSSAAIASTVTVGQTGVARSVVYFPDRFQNPVNLGIGVTVTGTVNYSVQHTFDDIQLPTPPIWIDNSGLASQTGNLDGNYVLPVRGVSLLLNSGAGTAKMTIIQASW